MATRRDRCRPLQRLWLVSQAPWPSPAYLTQDGCDQEPEPRKDDATGLGKTKEGSFNTHNIPNPLVHHGLPV